MCVTVQAHAIHRYICVTDTLMVFCVAGVASLRPAPRHSGRHRPLQEPGQKHGECGLDVVAQKSTCSNRHIILRMFSVVAYMTHQTRRALLLHVTTSM